MINPAIPYAMRGAIWYQGESIVGGSPASALSSRDGDADPGLAQALGRRRFSVLRSALPALKNISNNPRIREGQADVLSLPNTGLAVTIDIGDPKDVHPHNKEPLGNRLMRIALANVYHRNIEYSGPVYESMAIEGMPVRIKFTHLGGGLVAKDGPLKWFQISGADRQFVDADAKIDGNTVVVSRPDVTMPEAVRSLGSTTRMAAIYTTRRACPRRHSARISGEGGGATGHTDDKRRSSAPLRLAVRSDGGAEGFSFGSFRFTV